MFLLRILFNAILIAAEIGACCLVAMAGFTHPFLFAGVSALIVLALGVRLEVLRLRNELPFYFLRASRLRLLLVPVIGAGEACFKALIAGVAAVFTFAGTNSDRLYWVAVIFGLTVYAGASLLRVLSIHAGAFPARWGFFRLAPLLGLLFSAGLAIAGSYGLIAGSSVGDIGWKLVWEIPEKPSIDQVSELVFQLKQAFDDFVVTLLSAVIGKEWARIAGIVISVNMLAGLVAAVYAALIAGATRAVEDRVP